VTAGGHKSIVERLDVQSAESEASATAATCIDLLVLEIDKSTVAVYR